MNFIYKSPIDYKSKVIHLDSSAMYTFAHLRECILRKENLPEWAEISLYFNGKPLREVCEFESNDAFLQVSLSIKGGKGGFGSMLRAIGAQIEKTTNREACRDLSGRRLRDVNEEKRIKEWIKKQADKKEEEEKKKKEKLKRLAEMTAPASCQYSDTDFEKTRAEIPDIVEESINYGLQQSSKQQQSQAGTSVKRKADDSDSNLEQSEINVTETGKRPKGSEEKPIKKQALWLGVDLVSDDDSDSSDDDNSSDEADKKDGAATKAN